MESLEQRSFKKGKSCCQFRLQHCQITAQNTQSVMSCSRTQTDRGQNMWCTTQVEDIDMDPGRGMSWVVNQSRMVTMNHRHDLTGDAQNGTPDKSNGLACQSLPCCLMISVAHCKKKMISNDQFVWQTRWHNVGKGLIDPATLTMLSSLTKVKQLSCNSCHFWKHR